MIRVSFNRNKSRQNFSVVWFGKILRESQDRHTKYNFLILHVHENPDYLLKYLIMLLERSQTLLNSSTFLFFSNNYTVFRKKPFVAFICLGWTRAPPLTASVCNFGQGRQIGCKTVLTVDQDRGQALTSYNCAG